MNCECLFCSVESLKFSSFSLEYIRKLASYRVDKMKYLHLHCPLHLIYILHELAEISFSFFYSNFLSRGNKISHFVLSIHNDVISYRESWGWALTWMKRALHKEFQISFVILTRFSYIYDIFSSSSFSPYSLILYSCIFYRFPWKINIFLKFKFFFSLRWTL